MSNAFVPVVRTRPCPIFGRPVHLRVAPIDYGPILLLKPFGFRIAPNTLSSGRPQDGGFRSALAVSGFRLRARLDFSIPAFSSRPARHYPRLWIQRPSFERRGDFNPHDSRAAQRTLLPRPNPHPRACSSLGFCLHEPDRHALPATDEASQVPCKELLHVHKVSDCARFSHTSQYAMGRCCLLASCTRSAPRK
jgi:hypothetical protein